MAVFEGKKSSNDIIINDTMSDDELVASDVPPRYLLLDVRRAKYGMWSRWSYFGVQKWNHGNWLIPLDMSTRVWRENLMYRIHLCEYHTYSFSHNLRFPATFPDFDAISGNSMTGEWIWRNPAVDKCSLRVLALGWLRDQNRCALPRVRLD